MSDIVLLTSHDSYWGAEEAGVETRRLADPERIADHIAQLVSRGVALIAVTEEVAGERLELLRDLIREQPREVSLIVLPADGASHVASLEFLRERFSTALGVDVWEAAARRARVRT